MSSESPAGGAPVTTREVRLLEGPNLYFPRPAVQVTLDLPGYLTASADELRAVCAALGLRRASPGAPGSEQRQRLLLRVVEKAARAVAAEAGTRRLGIRTRPRTETAVVVCAFVWRHRGRAEAARSCARHRPARASPHQPCRSSGPHGTRAPCTGSGAAPCRA